MHILYVEDNPADARLIQRFFATTSHEMTLATTVEEAWEQIESGTDLVLIDLMLNHHRDGYTLARELRAEGYEGPLVAVTALTTPLDQEECYDVGFDDILTKPFTIDQLVDVVNRYS